MESRLLCSQRGQTLRDSVPSPGPDKAFSDGQPSIQYPAACVRFVVQASPRPRIRRLVCGSSEFSRDRSAATMCRPLFAQLRIIGRQPIAAYLSNGERDIWLGAEGVNDPPGENAEVENSDD